MTWIDNRDHWEQMRDHAETQTCEYCGAQPGEHCINRYTQQPVVRLPAHPIRCARAEAR